MRLRFAVLLVLIAAIPAAAQQPRFGEKIEVRVVEVDVVVTDKAGNHVHGLTARDFEVLEGRRAQTITNFTEFKQAMNEKKGKDPSIEVGAHLAASDHFASEGGLFRLRRKTAAMRRLVASLAATSGKKSLLYVSESFSMPQDLTRVSAIPLIEQLAQAANSGGITVYAIRPEDDPEIMRHVDALRRLTQPTGGVLDWGLRAIETVGESLAADLDSYYSIAYRASSDGRDRERKIVVRVKNPAYRVRAREAYVEKSNETVAREMLLARLFSDEEGGDVHFEVEQGQPKRISRDQWQMPIIVRIPADQLQFASENGAQVAHVKILIASANGVVEVTNVNERDLRVVAGRDTPGGFITYSVEILGDRRGSKVSIGALDQRTGLAGVRTIDNRGRFR